MDISLNRKVALISGGASGIGAATAREFVARGAAVIVADIDCACGQTLVQDIGGSIAFVPLDVTTEDSWIAAVSKGEECFGPISILVNNAGISGPGNSEGPIEDTDLTLYRQLFEVNQIGVLLGMKHIVPSMRRAGGGAIVNLSSVAGIRGGFPLAVGYVSSKFAVTGMTKVAAIEFAQYGIRVNSVHPGAIDTHIHFRDQPDEDADVTRNILKKATDGLPLARLGQAHEVARMISFVASDSASYSTGAEFVLDGGQLLGAGWSLD